MSIKLPHRRILLCEKNAYFMDLTLQALRMVGVRDVSGYRDSRNALGAASPGHFDAAIVSEDTQPLDGFALIDRLRSMDPSRESPLPFILLCDRVDGGKLKRLRAMESAHVLIRPFSASELAQRVTTLFANSIQTDTADNQDDGDPAFLL